MGKSDAGLESVRAERRLRPDELAAQTAYMQGAAGIAMFLLQLDAFDQERKSTITLPDSVFGERWPRGAKRCGTCFHVVVRPGNRFESWGHCVARVPQAAGSGRDPEHTRAPCALPASAEKFHEFCLTF